MVGHDFKLWCTVGHELKCCGVGRRQNCMDAQVKVVNRFVVEEWSVRRTAIEKE